VGGEGQDDVLLDAGLPEAAGRGGVGQLQVGFQQQEQVEQVDAGVQDDAAAGARGLQLPAGRAVGMAAVADQQVERAQWPERSVARSVQQLADPRKEAVVVAHEARLLEARGGLDESLSLLAAQAEWLLHQHRAAGGQDAVGGDLGEVVGQRDDRRIVGPGRDLVEGSEVRCVVAAWRQRVDGPGQRRARMRRDGAGALAADQAVADDQDSWSTHGLRR